jgi:hypothetical protein
MNRNELEADDNYGVVGIYCDERGYTLTLGYQTCITTQLSPYEKIELASLMIQRWAEYKRTLKVVKR